MNNVDHLANRNTVNVKIYTYKKMILFSVTERKSKNVICQSNDLIIWRPSRLSELTPY